MRDEGKGGRETESERELSDKGMMNRACAKPKNSG